MNNILDLRLKNALSWLNDKPGAMLDQLAHTSNGCNLVKKLYFNRLKRNKKDIKPKTFIKPCSSKEVEQILKEQTNI